MVTVAELIDRLSKLPSDALVEVLTATTHSSPWNEHIVVSKEAIDLETDIEYKDYRFVDPEKYPNFGGTHWIAIGRDNS
jgi:hypothetical protein